MFHRFKVPNCNVAVRDFFGNNILFIYLFSLEKF